MKLSGLAEKTQVLNINVRVISSLLKYHFASFTTEDELSNYDNIRKNFLDVIKDKYTAKQMYDSFFEITRTYLLDKKNFSYAMPGVSVNPKLFNGVITAVNKEGVYWTNRVFELIRMYNKSFSIQHPVTSRRHYFCYDDDMDRYLKLLSKDAKYIDLNKSKHIIKNYILRVIDKEYPILGGCNKQVQDIIDHMVSVYGYKGNRKVKFTNDNVIVEHLLDTNYLNKNSNLRKMISETVQLKSSRMVTITLESVGEELLVMFNRSYKDVERLQFTSVPTVIENTFNSLNIGIKVIQAHQQFETTASNKRLIGRSVSRYTNYLLEPVVTRNYEVVTISGEDTVLYDYKTPQSALENNFSLKQMEELLKEHTKYPTPEKVTFEKILEVIIEDAKKASTQYNSNFIVGMDIFRYMLLIANEEDIVYKLFREMMKVSDGMDIDKPEDIEFMNSRLLLSNKVIGSIVEVGDSVEEDTCEIEVSEEIVISTKPQEGLLDPNMTIESFNRNDLIVLYDKFLQNNPDKSETTLYQFTIMDLEGLLTEENIDTNLIVVMMDKATSLLTEEDRKLEENDDPSLDDVVEETIEEEDDIINNVPEDVPVVTPVDVNTPTADQEAEEPVESTKEPEHQDTKKPNIFVVWFNYIKDILF